jgi:hypothetical protein
MRAYLGANARIVKVGQFLHGASRGSANFVLDRRDAKLQQAETIEETQCATSSGQPPQAAELDETRQRSQPQLPS